MRTIEKRKLRKQKSAKAKDNKEKRQNKKQKDDEDKDGDDKAVEAAKGKYQLTLPSGLGMVTQKRSFADQKTKLS